MIRYISGNLFDSSADALVNPVNSKGRMGRGIALEFKRRFPEFVKPYYAACQSGELRPGRLMYANLLIYPEGAGGRHQGVVFFPTKDHWRGRSKLKWIDEGLENLKHSYRQWGLRSLAMPALGCGLGGLDWVDVRMLIERHFAEEPLEVQVYLDAGDLFGESRSPWRRTSIQAKAAGRRRIARITSAGGQRNR